MKPTVALLVLVLYCLPLQAEPLGLSLDEAMELAVANSQVIHDQENVVAKALRNMDNSWNLYLPGVTADLIASYKDSIFYPSQTSRSVSPLSTSLKMDIKLSLDTKSLFERKKRGDDYATALLLAQEVQRKFVMGAEKDYFSLVASSLDVNNSLRTLDLDEELYRQTKVRFERGLEPELSLLNADLKLQGTRTAVMSSQAAYDKKAMAFRRLIGLEPQIMFTLTTPLAFTELDGKNIEDLLRAIEARLDLEIKRMAIEASTVAINRYHAITRLPLLSLGSSLSYGLSDFSVPSDGFSISAGVSFGVDAWIPGSQKDLAYRLLLEEREQQVVEYDRMLEAAKEKVEDLTIDLSLKINDLRLTEAKLALAERIHAQTRTAYDRGTVTLYTLDDAQNKVEVQRQALVSTKLAYLQLVIDIGYALGVDWRSLIGLTS